MKLIDKKGKLFGLINIIDLLFLVILLVALVGGYMRFKDSSIVAESTNKGKITLMVEEVRQPTIDNIKVGQDIYHYDKGIYFGKITSTSVRPFKEPIDLEGEWIDAEVPGKYTVYVDLDVEITQNEKSYMIGGEEIRVGNSYRVKSKTSTFTGVCVGISVEE